ncbi:hypothetical protein Q7279_11210, partial [Glaesserella parasuis]|nr:hypothetical protein [Glaesserella parasuis]
LQLSADYRLLLDRPIAKFRANHTACQTTEQNNRLPKASRCGYDDCTTKTNGGNRSRHESGIFLPTIPQNHGITTPEIYSELVARATLRNKPSNRTNKEGYNPLVLVVDPLPRLLSVGKLSKNKPTEQPKMKTSTQSPSGNTARNVSIALSFATKGGVYA